MTLHPRHLRSVLPLLLAVLVAAAPLDVQAQRPSPTDVIAKVRERFAPDPRVAVFDVKADAKGRAVDLTGDIEQPEARAALLSAFKGAGYANVTDRITMLPDPSLADRPLGIVTVSVAVMKARAAHSSELTNQLIMGMVVRTLKKDGGWYYVQSLDDRYLGWMESDHLALVSREQAQAKAARPHAIVTALFAQIREQAAPDAPPISDLVAGDLLEITGQSGPWFAVQLPDGRKGFVRQTDATDLGTWRASRVITGYSIEQTARRFMGVPYLWGGTSARGFDCSGFVKTVFRLNGLDLPRDADQQSNEGEAVAATTSDDLAKLRKGDVLFFGPRPGVTRITHEAIYLGDRLFIHCSGLVKLNSFDPASPIYSENLLKRLVKVRRFKAAA